MGGRERLADEVAASGTPVYGLTTGLGVQKRTALSARRLPASAGGRSPRAAPGVGPPAPPDVVRAAMLVFANQMAGGSTASGPSSPSVSRRR